MVKNVFGRIYIGLIMLFLYAPIVVLIVLSFNNSKSRAKWGGFTLKWYSELFDNSIVMDALWTTLTLAILSAVIATVLGLLGAIGIDAMKKRNYQIMLGATNIPMLNADIVTGIALMLFMVRFLPLGFSTMLIAHITFNIPYVIFSILPKLQQIDVSVYEAARDLGANSVKAFWKVIIPIIKPGITSGFLLAVTMSLDDFIITYFTRGAGVNTLSTVIYGEIRRGIKPEMYSLSTILFLMVLIVLVMSNRASKKQVK
ncbi:MAG: ABC transporter permease [Lachnospiraceae bacterium]|nr:ABC transporter permease [Lachnospiraceae bacterium]MBR3683952.1 ABC transporter permease [Lachnospiraceae bacterium]